MQFSILALLVAATGALAAPGNRGGDRGDRGGNRGDRNTNTQTVTCTGGSAYCCSPEYGEGRPFQLLRVQQEHQQLQRPEYHCLLRPKCPRKQQPPVAEMLCLRRPEGYLCLNSFSGT
ncbi:hypothetical protein NW765_015347 [Fusarium oxysporum]|nr:hypothetical protein NW765_015347 [Fusarium oxysporum]